MCQMSVILTDEKGETLIMKDAAELKVIAGGVQVNRMFERPKEIKEVKITSIDFLDGKVYLAPA